MSAVLVEEHGGGYRWTGPCGEKGKKIHDSDYGALLEFRYHRNDCTVCDRELSKSG